MASISSSQSEGEILSDTSAKATRSLSSRKGIHVDRQTRPYLAANTPPATRSNRSRSRSRSRSPYRASRDEKRRRYEDRPSEGSRPGTRSSRLRYDEEKRDSRSRRQGSCEDLDPGRPKRSNLHYDDELERGHHPKRRRTHSRSRSRSPFRHNRKDYRSALPSHRENGGFPEGKSRRYNGTRGWPRADEARAMESVSERSNASKIARRPVINTETQANQDNHDNPSHEPNTTQDKRGEPDVGRVETNGASDAAKLDQKPTDEAALIEERRRRRDAIKNKYRGQATPMLVQALHLDSKAIPTIASANASQAASEGPDSPMPASPQTPKDTSGLQSPTDIIVANDEELANRVETAPADENEASAADYDPTLDMQEERSRHDKRLFAEGLSGSHEKTQRSPKQIPPTLEEAPESSKTAFDMFAEEDDNDLDMFAGTVPKPKSKPENEAKRAQALDVTMMDNWDDPEGYYNTILSELIEGRYHVQQNLGRGMFSSVIRAQDVSTSRLVAIKIVRNNETMRKAGLREIEILKNLAENDPDDKKHIIRLIRSFDHKGHLCMVFENLSLNLREVLKKFGRDIGINLKAIRAYAQQLFLGLSLLKKCQYLHADLKPDNILVNESRSALKICDLGSASSITEATTAPYLVSRFYRAPEIILGMSYDYAIDVWSIGCTLFELYTGKILFTGRNNNGMLRSIMECRGKFPHKLLRKGSLTYQYFDDLLNFQTIEEDKLTGRTVTKTMEIKARPVRDLRSRLVPKGKRLDDAERKEMELFLDLLEKCLDLRPEKRITPNEALKHPFILRAKS